MRKFAIRLIAMAAVAGSLALSASASAATFCVHSTPDCSGTGATSLQAALTSAANNGPGTRDTIQLPAGTYVEGPAIDAAGNPVDIVGAGRTDTILQAAGNSQIVLSVLEPSSTVSHLEVSIVGTQAETGIKLAGSISDVAVVSLGNGWSTTGIWVVGSSAAISASNVLMLNYSGANPWANAVFADFGSSVSITDSTLYGEEGLYVVGASATLERTRIRAQRGVEVLSDGYVSLRNSTVMTPGQFQSGHPEVALIARGSGTNIIDALQTTVSGSGSGTGIVENLDQGASALVELTDSVVAGYGTVAQVPAGATLNTIYSAFNFGAITGAGAHNHLGDLDMTGRNTSFQSAGGGQFALRSSSPLIDAGDPNASTSGQFDFAKAERYRDGDGKGGAQVDIGAYEYQHVPPSITADAAPATADPGQPIAFTAAAKDADTADLVTITWSFDDGETASGASAQHAFTSPGPHLATATATDNTGLQSTATVQVSVTGAAGPPEPAGGAAPAPGTPATAPVLAGLRLSPTTFRPLGIRPRGAVKRVHAGSKLTFKLSQAATVTVVIQRLKRGHWVKVATLRVKRAAGAGSIRIDGRAKRHPLPRGRYRLRVAAKNAAGMASATRSVKFKLVR